MSAREILRSLFENPLIWVLGSALGLCAAVVDLHSSTRWPYAMTICAIAVLLTLLQPKWPWRWALLAALILPTFVLLSGNWGAYQVDRFDVFYGVVPGGLGTLLGMGIRRLGRIRRRPPAIQGNMF